jgi:PAS domain S-box-containing protein
MTSLEELKKMLNQAPCGIGLFEYKGNGKAAYLNDTYYRLIGYTRDEYASLGESVISDLIYQEDLHVISANSQKMDLVGSADSEYRITRKDGQLRWIKLNASKMDVDGQNLIFCAFTDITTEKEIASRLNLICDHVGCSISIMQISNGTHSPIYTNDMFYEMLGVSREEYARAPTEYNRKALTPEDWEHVGIKVRKALESGKSGSVDYWLCRPDGTRRYVNRNFSAVRQGLDDTFWILSVVTDLTKQKQTDEILQNERSRYRLALEQTHATVFEWDCKTNAFYCSDSYQKYAVSQVDNQTILRNKGPLDAVYPDDIPVLQQFFAGAGNPNVQHECILRLKMTDGSYRWSRVSGQETLDKDGKLMCAIGVIMDINDEMEKSLMMNELVSMLPGGVGIFKFTAEIQCLYFNQAMLKLGIPVDTSNGQDTHLWQWMQKRILPSDRELFRAEVSDKAALGENINCNFRYDKTGNFTGREIGWIHLSAVKIREEDGCPVYYAILSEPSNQSKIFMQISERSLVAELALESPSGKILYANRAFCTLANLGNDAALIGCDCGEVLPSADVDALKKVLRRGFTEETVETALWTSCGRYLKIQAHVLNWNGKNAMMFYFSNQTETQKLNDRLAKIINSVPSGIGLYEIRDGKAVQLSLNDEYHRMLHDTREKRQQYAGENFLNAVYPADRPSFQALIADLAHGAQTAQITYRVKDGRGKWVWLRFNGKAVEDDEGRKIIYCSFFDVDEQTQMQLSLKQEQTRLKLAMQTAKMDSWEYDVQQKKLSQTAGFQSQRIRTREIENVPEALIQGGYIHPDSAKEYRRLFLPAANENDVRHADVYIKTPESRDYWCERIFATPIFDSNGTNVKFIGTNIDVTDQKNAERNYRRQMQELSSADSPDLIAKCLYNLTKNQLESYDARTGDAIPAADVTSYDDGLRKTAETFIKPSECSTFLRQFDRRQLLQSFAKGETEAAIEYQRKAKDGTIFWARTQCKMACEPGGENVFCFIYSYDINEKKIAQETIHTVIGQDYDFFAVLDCRSNSHVLYSDNAEDRHAMLPPQHSMDYERTVREYAATYLEESDAAQSVQDMSISTIRSQLENHQTYSCYANMKMDDGQVHRKKLQFSYLDRENEQVLITRMDITDIYAQEQKRMTQLRDAVQAAQMANSVKMDFLARMSHDLRTPMNAVIGLAELARKELMDPSPTDPSSMEYYVSNIISSGKLLLGLVNDCLDFEKIAENRMQLHPVPCPYAEFRQSISTMVTPLCQAKNIEFVFGPNTTSYTVRMDPVRLEQIFINLLTNAVKFTPEGGKVEFLTCNHDHRGNIISCDFIVRDNGIGISAEFQKRMFEPFEQEPGNAAAQVQGTGLGLAIVKSLVDLMHGSISAKSEVGRGTEFTVHLDMPIVEDAEAEAPKVQTDVQISLKGHRALLVEDHPLNTEIARRLLENEGVQVTCAGNGKEALETFEQAQPNTWDVILMDIRMPIMDGLQATRAIRALDREDAKTIPIIAMTANAFEEDVQASRNAGMNAHLAKPIEPQRLYETLSCILK